MIQNRSISPGTIAAVKEIIYCNDETKALRKDLIDLFRQLSPHLEVMEGLIREELTQKVLARIGMIDDSLDKELSECFDKNLLEVSRFEDAVNVQSDSLTASQMKSAMKVRQYLENGKNPIFLAKALYPHDKAAQQKFFQRSIISPAALSKSQVRRSTIPAGRPLENKGAGFDEIGKKVLATSLDHPDSEGIAFSEKKRVRWRERFLSY
ncbi:MAG: hypothetical protein V4489_01405 [Chlamydiota bacterium]